MRPRAVIFDCDGVLFDSWRANVAYYDAIRARLGLEPMCATWRERAHVLAAAHVLEAMFGDDPALHAEATAIARDLDYGPFYELMDPVPGLHEVLATLRPSHRLGLATNRGRTVHEVVRRFGLDRWLDVALGVLDVARPKPHPDLLEAAVARLGVAAHEAVYVGDAPSDLAAATAAGVHFIGVGERPWAPVQVRTLVELPARLDDLAAA